MVKQYLKANFIQKNRELEKVKKQKKYIKTNSKTISGYIKAVQGSRTQTKQININLKSLTVKYLLPLTKSKEFNYFQIQIIQMYEKIPPSFQGTNFLFSYGPFQSVEKAKLLKQIGNGHALQQINRNKIQSKCYKFYCSSGFASQIIKSQKMFMINKIAMIKYLRVIEQGVFFNQADLSHNQQNQQENQDHRNQGRQSLQIPRQEHLTIQIKVSQEVCVHQNEREKRRKFIKKRQWKCRPFQFILNRQTQSFRKMRGQ